MRTKTPRQKRPAKQRWPFVRTRRYPSGAVSWIVDARTETGGKKRVFDDRAAATGYAEQCRVLRQSDGAAAFGNRELAQYGKTVQNAVAFYLAHLRLEKRSVPVRDAIVDLVEVRRAAGRSEGYCRDLRNRLGRFQTEYGDSSVIAITSGDLDAWLAGLKVAPGTRNTFRRDLRTLFSFCVKRGFCTRNPAADTVVATRVDAPPGILTVEQTKRLLSVAPENMMPYVAIGAFAGLRSAELATLDWSEVDLDSNLIEVTAKKAKTSRRRLVTISDNLSAWLKPLRKNSGAIVPDALRYRWDDVKRAAGFGTPGTETSKEREAGVKFREWPSNALRHSYGSYWLAEHQDAAALALQMGNSPQMVFGHYRELVKPKDAAAFWKIVPE